MEHVAIDLGGRESQVCVRAADGTILDERLWPTGKLSGYLRKRPVSRVVVETSAEAFAVADSASEQGHEVRVVPATLVRSLGVGARGIKTDRRDAQVLSEVSCRIDLPSVHVPSEESRSRKSMCGAREALVDTRTKLINTVRGWLRTQLLKIPSGRSETFPKRIRDKLVSEPDGSPEFIERLLVVLEKLNEQIGEADKELEQLAQEDDLCQRLMTTPGVGAVTAVRYSAALDEVGRFAGAHAVESYLGLTPGENSSSTRKRRTGITKAGPPKVRWALVQACWAMRRCRPDDPMVQWAEQVEQRRGKRIAIVAMARKLAGILYAMWRDGTDYDPHHEANKNKT
ncbi:MAG: IS110 family transposase [Deltaproteobacteria bacterium]|nr:IS110 family transposase [Deltaproteobacteria bacterium]